VVFFLGRLHDLPARHRPLVRVVVLKRHVQLPLLRNMIESLHSSFPLNRVSVLIKFEIIVIKVLMDVIWLIRPWRLGWRILKRLIDDGFVLDWILKVPYKFLKFFLSILFLFVLRQDFRV
jgi:hypothetical protein